jgi:superfamily II DNA/RNA helicase
VHENKPNSDFMKEGKMKELKKRIDLNMLSTEDDKKATKTEGITNWSDIGLIDPFIHLLNKEGFQIPTKIQSEVISYMIDTNYSSDLLMCATTGQGKTLAYTILILHYYLYMNKGQFSTRENQKHLKSNTELDKVSMNKETAPPIALIIVPTRELGIQVQEQMNPLCKEYQMSIATIIGGMSKQKQIRILNKYHHILIATSGRLAEILDDSISPLINLIYK